jgi:hypothetical protein
MTISLDFDLLLLMRALALLAAVALPLGGASAQPWQTPPPFVGQPPAPIPYAQPRPWVPQARSPLSPDLLIPLPAPSTVYRPLPGGGFRATQE